MGFRGLAEMLAPLVEALRALLRLWVRGGGWGTGCWWWTGRCWTGELWVCGGCLEDSLVWGWFLGSLLTYG